MLFSVRFGSSSVPETLSGKEPRLFRFGASVGPEDLHKGGCLNSCINASVRGCYHLEGTEAANRRTNEPRIRGQKHSISLKHHYRIFFTTGDSTSSQQTIEHGCIEYMINHIEASENSRVARPENIVGWYHSHPGYKCWLSGIDVMTQQ